MTVQNVIFKNKQYAVSDLPEEARQLFSLLGAANEQIARAKASAAVAETARQVLNAKLESILGGVAASEVGQG
jgi:hypothetical protein